MVVAVEVAGGDVSQTQFCAADGPDAAAFGGDSSERGDNALAHFRLPCPVHTNQRISDVRDVAYMKRASAPLGPTHKSAATFFCEVGLSPQRIVDDADLNLAVM